MAATWGGQSPSSKRPPPPPPTQRSVVPTTDFRLAVGRQRIFVEAVEAEMTDGATGADAQVIPAASSVPLHCRGTVRKDR